MEKLNVKERCDEAKVASLEEIDGALSEVEQYRSFLKKIKSEKERQAEGWEAEVCPEDGVLGNEEWVLGLSSKEMEALGGWSEKERMVLKNPKELKADEDRLEWAMIIGFMIVFIPITFILMGLLTMGFNHLLVQKPLPYMIALASLVVFPMAFAYRPSKRIQKVMAFREQVKQNRDQSQTITKTLKNQILKKAPLELSPVLNDALFKKRCDPEE